MTYYKKMNTREIISSKEADKQSKLLSLYNQLNNTDYTLDSVGIELVHRVPVGNYIYQSEPDTNFGWYARTGVPYSNRLSEKEKKELQGRWLYENNR